MPRKNNRQYKKKTGLPDNHHVGDDLSLSEEYTISWVYDEQYRSMPEDRAEIERTIVEFFHYLAQKGFNDIGAARIYSTMHKTNTGFGDKRDHIQVRVYAKDGHRWRIRKGKKDRWGAIHIPKDRLLWRPLLFVEKNA